MASPPHQRITLASSSITTALAQIIAILGTYYRRPQQECSSQPRPRVPIPQWIASALSIIQEALGRLPPRAESRTLPPRDESRTLPPRAGRRTSPPHTGSRTSPPRAERGESWTPQACLCQLDRSSLTSPPSPTSPSTGGRSATGALRRLFVCVLHAKVQRLHNQRVGRLSM